MPNTEGITVQHTAKLFSLIIVIIVIIIIIYVLISS
jgi:hypothetical protein